jgi:hypothetical protein
VFGDYTKAKEQYKAVLSCDEKNMVAVKNLGIVEGLERESQSKTSDY